jgi:hypothetical protein
MRRHYAERCAGSRSYWTSSWPGGRVGDAAALDRDALPDVEAPLEISTERLQVVKTTGRCGSAYQGGVPNHAS